MIDYLFFYPLEAVSRAATWLYWHLVGELENKKMRQGARGGKDVL